MMVSSPQIEPDDKVLYIDSGFLDQAVKVDGTPRYNSQYPNSWATTSFPVTQGDIVDCSAIHYNNSNVRVRWYDKNGTQYGKLSAGINVSTPSDFDAVAARMMVIDDFTNEPVIPTKLTVKHTDSTVTAYRIEDRRGES